MTLSRRRFLAAGAASLGAAVLGRPRAAAGTHPPRIGLALGGGGARGLAHVPILEVFDELGLRPHRIAGSSIGAVIGALYAAGRSADDIRALVDRLVVNTDEAWTEALLEQDVLQWWRFLDLEAERGGLICPDHLMEFLRRESGVERFDQLAIPLDVVATDFWERTQVVIDSGALWPAVRASMALPGLFPPVRHLDRTLVDGGLVNPVPYDLLLNRCDLVVAVDVLGRRTPQDGLRPGYLENLFNSVQIMQAALTRERLRNSPPDVYVAPDLLDVRVLDFFKADRIMRDTEPARRRLEDRLRAIAGLVGGP